ncbi:MAG: flagellar hook-basal body protein [Sulfobacillus acidophilus]|uniref:Flagellar hook-basal body protein n=1 Tax=Sulfobacillus acidophilus TaxID=53633 RepID=A0A2T2WM99_9FIRM|nr:MAG: flagellar hook-basal body protein [Sulfobacillus acidophilus]
MFSVLGIGASGLAAQNDVLNAIAANIANLNTPGYGESDPALASTTVVATRPSGTNLLGQTLNAPLSLTSGVGMVANAPVFSNDVQQTESASNLAIEGNGFFMVSGANGLAFTRAGMFELDAGGELVLPGGQKLYPPISIPVGEQFSVSADGVVTVSGPNGSQVVGQIKIASIPNPQGLVSEGDSLYGLSANSGRPTVTTPGQNGTGTLLSSALNQSGSSLAQNMVDLVQAETAYSVNAKMISVDAQVLQSTTDLQA